MIDPTVVLKWAALAGLLIALTSLTYMLAQSRDTWLHQLYQRYRADLERRMRMMFIELRPEWIMLGQAVGLVFLIALGAGVARMAFMLVPLVIVGPIWELERQRKQRVQKIEQSLDGFVVALANALRASPSAGRALAMIQPVTAPPLSQEIELVLREMHVGSTLDQALANLSARVRSFELDAAMTGLLIGRQTGGDVPAILDGAAATLREMMRLRGVLRTKTAEGRAQANVLAIFPLALILVFELAQPGYFKPLTESFTGAVIMVVALLTWGASVAMSRKILSVEL
ncbi:MAG TPA: type II secretion system F family protein [Polyangiales bacterium]|nr:type II secretion system F family protein [Polyangiales bacterium]